MTESLRDVIEDIQDKLRNGVYENEEHVRLSLVARVLHALEWNIWDPMIVNAEFPVKTIQDANRRSDLALLDGDDHRLVFIEIKKVGELSRNATHHITQLRSHNEDFRAPFAILTDGRQWWFYYIYYGSSYENSRFKVIDLLEGDLDDIEISFKTFLTMLEITSKRAQNASEAELLKSEKLKKLEELVPEAKRIADEEGTIAPVAVLMELTRSKGQTVTQEQAEEAYRNWKNRGIKPQQNPIKPPELQSPKQPSIEPIVTQTKNHEKETAGPIKGKTPSTPPTSVTLNGKKKLITKANEILILAAEYLVSEGLLTKDRVPIKSGTSYYLVNIQPVNANGRPFEKSARKELSNGLWLNTNFDRENCLKRAKELLARFLPQATLTVEWQQK